MVITEFYSKLPLKYVCEPVQGLSQARNKGLKVASGKLIIFTDDDVKPCAEWLQQYWEAYQERPDGFFFGGPVQSEFETGKPPADLLAWAPFSVKGLNWGKIGRVLEPGEDLLAANWGCSLEKMIEIGGFDTQFGLNPSSGRVRTGEETDLMKRLRESGLKPWYIPRALIAHFVDKKKCTLKHIAERRKAYGFYQGRSLGKKFQNKLVIAGVPFSLGYEIVFRFLHWILAKFRGKKGYSEYIKLKYSIGMLIGVREVLLNDEKRY
jgi:GT2 family glycosyltransferase